MEVFELHNVDQTSQHVAEDFEDPLISEDMTTGLRHETSLAPVDGGIQAWMLLLAAFLVEVLVGGFPSSFGVLLVAYMQDPVYIRKRMHQIYFLLLVQYAQVSYIAHVTLLVALQGVLFAIGGSLVYAPVFSYMSEWFVNRRGLANGIVFTGANAGGVLFPLIFPPLIAHFRLMKTTRIYAIAMAMCLIPVLPFMKARLPETRVHGPAPRSSSTRTWLFNKNFWFFIAINTFQGLGHFIPLIWLPTFASSLGVSAAQSSLALTVLNGVSVIAGLSIGYLSDRFDIWMLAIVSLVGTCLATFLLWGLLSYTLAGILVYSAIYGGTAGCWSSMWFGFVNPIAKDDPSLSTTIFSFLLLTRGIGNILSTPISTTLLQDSFAASHLSQSRVNSGFAVANGKFNAMILYAGTCFAGATIVAVIGWAVDRRTRSAANMRH